VAVKIKLKRLGKIRAPYYRIVVADSRTKRDGRAIEEIGKYHPKTEPSFIEVDSERAQHWLSVGAQPTDPVRKILEITGDWQKFKGLPGAEGTLRVAEPKADRKVAFAEALQETLSDSGATTPRGKARTRSGEPAARTAKPEKADAAKADKAAKGDKADAEKAADKGGKASGDKASRAKADGPAAAAAPVAEAAPAEVAPADSAPADSAPAEVAPADSAPADAPADAASSEG
jgi:small subunit ribosomal protein S16